MPEYNGPYIYAGIHDFKTNISKYITLLEHEAYQAVLIKRRAAVIGVFITQKGADKRMARLRQYAQEKNQEEKNQADLVRETGLQAEEPQQLELFDD